MTTREFESADESSALLHLIADAGHTESPRIGEFTRLAAAVQFERHRAAVSDTDRITRSTALWTLMQLDEDIREALQKSGIDHAALGKLISVQSPPGRSGVESAELHTDFAVAIRTYLSERSDREPIDLPDIALAILEAGRNSSNGLLPGRLRLLTVDVNAAISAIEGIHLTTHPIQVFSEEDFSESVRDARRRLGQETTVKPAQIAKSIQEDHPDYGRGRFKEVNLRTTAGKAARVDDWLDRVRNLYDLTQVSQTRHQVVDGVLLLLGLAELDASLAEDLRVEGFIEALRSEAELVPHRASSDRTEWATDAPADKDLLGRERLAEALAKRVKRLAEPESSSRKSFLVHVDGPWGAGKSTLFEFLKLQLEPRFLVVSINAWHEQRVGVQWWTLLGALRRAVASDKPWYLRPLTRLAGLGDRIRAGWVPFMAALLVLGAVLFALVSVADLDLTASGQLADSMLRVISLASVAFAGLLGAARYLLPGSRKSAKEFVETHDNPMEELGRLFARTLQRADKPVVFLIDDLDRCDEDYVVEFLEVVQTLVRDAPRFLPDQVGVRSRFRKRADVAGPYVFIAADGRWIRSSYEKHYETFKQTSAPGRPLGYLFLEKVFQLHVRLPSITSSAKEAFLASLLLPQASHGQHPEPQADLVKSSKAAVDNAKDGDELLKAAQSAGSIQDPIMRMDVLGDAAVKFSERDIEVATEHELAPFSIFLEPNPRSMKLFVNTYGVLRSLRTLEESFVPSGPLALWTVIEIRWPFLADYLRAHPEAAEHTRNAETEGSVPEYVTDLLLNIEVERVLTDVRYGPLTPKLIRDCSGSS